MNKVVSLVLLFYVIPLLAGGLLSKKEFTEPYAKQAIELDKGLTYKINHPLEIVFKTSDGEEKISYLDNAYNDYQSYPAELDNIVTRYLSSLMDVFLTENIIFTKAQIFPVIKDSHYLKEVPS